MALSDAHQFGIDAQQLAWVVAQALNGGLPVLSWGAPYNLASLWVERTRLQQLAVWPNAEPGRSSPPSELSAARLEYVQRYRQTLAAQTDAPGATEKRASSLGQTAVTGQTRPVPVTRT